jgi:ATP-dependent Lon protease
MRKNNKRTKSVELKVAPRHPSLPAAKVRWKCTGKEVGCKSSDDLKPIQQIIGQQRALDALRVGFEMKHKGYNIFATGLPGTGKTTTIMRMLNKMVAAQQAELKDHCYLFNFEDPDSPVALALPAGQGRALRDDMENFVKNMVRDVPAMYESARYQDARKNIVGLFQDRQKSVLTELEKRVTEKGFQVVQVQMGNIARPDVMPMVDGNPQSMEALEVLAQKGGLPQQELEHLKVAHGELEKLMSAVFRQLRTIEHKLKESLNELDDRLVMPVIDDDIKVLKATYDHPALQEYFDHVHDYIRENLNIFKKKTTMGQPEGEERQEESISFVELGVNVLVDNSRQEQPPIIYETNPKYKNIFGTIEREMIQGGMWITDFMHLKAGALLRADGGYLILNAKDTLVEPWVWQDLKRTLRTGKLEIGLPESVGGFAPVGMKPQPVSLNVKVIMIGEGEIYDLMYANDEDFKKIFKIKADFDYVMPKTTATVKQYLSFVKMICNEEHLKPFDSKALGRLVEYGVRLSGDQKKLSTRFNMLSDVVREADYWATRMHSATVAPKHVKKAIDERIRRVSLYEDKLQEMLLEGSVLIDTKGKKVGQINGLSIYDLREHAFGKPTRITAKIALGRKGIINIERDAELSGSIHNKGVAIISGFLRHRFAQDKPLCIDASITFEQSYGGIDGDSASSTEIYAILSALSGIPLTQEIAVTGSVNQNGEIQPIGGVDLKIEGFFTLCKARGLTGRQGVIIPKQNVTNLILNEEVVEAIEKKTFHIYAVSTIDEGIEILTGVKSGAPKNDGRFEAGTLNELVNERLKKYTEDWRTFERGKVIADPTRQKEARSSIVTPAASHPR